MVLPHLEAATAAAVENDDASTAEEWCSMLERAFDDESRVKDIQQVRREHL
jgi:hypothetical protein